MTYDFDAYLERQREQYELNAGCVYVAELWLQLERLVIESDGLKGKIDEAMSELREEHFDGEIHDLIDKHLQAFRKAKNPPKENS